MNIYILCGIVLACVITFVIVNKINRNKIICPNCSREKKFSPEAKVGLCKKCAATHEFIIFKEPNKDKFGVVCLKSKPPAVQHRVVFKT
jgi:hypothetical protein